MTPQPANPTIVSNTATTVAALSGTGTAVASMTNQTTTTVNIDTLNYQSVWAELNVTWADSDRAWSTYDDRTAITNL